MDYMTYYSSFLPPEVDYSKLQSEVKLLLGIISFIAFRKPQPKTEIAYSSPSPVKGFNDIFSSISVAELRAMEQVKVTLLLQGREAV